MAYKYDLKHGLMPKSQWQRYKLLYDIYVATDGTGIMPVSKWAYRDKHGDICYYKGKTKIKVIPPVLKIYYRDSPKLPSDVAAYFESHTLLKVVLKYEGDPDEMSQAVDVINEHLASVSGLRK